MIHICLNLYVFICKTNKNLSKDVVRQQICTLLRDPHDNYTGILITNPKHPLKNGHIPANRNPTIEIANLNYDKVQVFT